VTRYALDTDVIIALELVDAGTGLDQRGPLPVVVTDVVWGELVAPGDPLARARNYAGAILAGDVTQFLPDTPEAETFLALQQPPKTEGPGEHSVIAYCHHHPDAIGVLQDKGALRRGVEEIRKRIISFHGFLEVLVSAGHLDWKEATAMATRYRRQYPHARLPVWWPVT
jgi:hypothetical protein